MTEFTNRQIALAHAMNFLAGKSDDPNKVIAAAGQFVEFLEPKDAPAPKASRSKKSVAAPAPAGVDTAADTSLVDGAATASPTEDLGLGEETAADAPSDSTTATSEEPASTGSDDLFGEEAPAPKAPASTATTRAGSTATKTSAAAAAKPASPATEKKAASKAPTIETVRTTLTELQTALGGKNAAIDHLVKYTNGGAKVLSALPEEKYQTLIDDAKKQIAAAPKK